MATVGRQTTQVVIGATQLATTTTAETCRAQAGTRTTLGRTTPVSDSMSAMDITTQGTARVDR